ncbi:Uncharacterized protein PBTT_07791 [Plasmodiophora brassicae]|uniref:Uncharacterized protein n=1 Tax=Plasmodiophora brassicae TaxID=37360 RepID=A0A0G4IXA9_PLABS|nr:hypothetical protein PBRA_007722 [Plasmodiophora brassicae]SPQ99028.1 unnamed protein product [Plasmodiophora brassicae]
MRRAGEWGGHIELQAAVSLYEVHIVVHQLNAPRLVMSHPTVRHAPTLNLSYHDREHYASCHPCGGRASPSPPDAITKQERVIMEQAQCTDLQRVRDLIQQLHGDTDACVECLIAERAATAQATTGRDEAAQAGRRMSKHDRKMMKRAAKVKVKAKGAVDDITDHIRRWRGARGTRVARRLSYGLSMAAPGADQFRAYLDRCGVIELLKQVTTEVLERPTRASSVFDFAERRLRELGAQREQRLKQERRQHRLERSKPCAQPPSRAARPADARHVAFGKTLRDPIAINVLTHVGNDDAMKKKPARRRQEQRSRSPSPGAVSKGLQTKRSAAPRQQPNAAPLPPASSSHATKSSMRKTPAARAAPLKGASAQRLGSSATQQKAKDTAVVHHASKASSRTPPRRTKVASARDRTEVSSGPASPDQLLTSASAEATPPGPVDANQVPSPTPVPLYPVATEEVRVDGAKEPAPAQGDLQLPATTKDIEAIPEKQEDDAYEADFEETSTTAADKPATYLATTTAAAAPAEVSLDALYAPVDVGPPRSAKGPVAGRRRLQ